MRGPVTDLLLTIYRRMPRRLRPYRGDRRRRAGRLLAGASRIRADFGVRISTMRDVNARNVCICLNTLRRAGTPWRPANLTDAVVRYQIGDLDRGIEFYTSQLGFRLEQRAGPVAIVSRGALNLLLSGPESSGSRPMDGQEPGARRLEPDRALRRRSRGGRRPSAQRRRDVPKRRHGRPRRQTGPDHRPRRQSDRVARSAGLTGQ